MAADGILCGAFVTLLAFPPLVGCGDTTDDVPDGGILDSDATTGDAGDLIRAPGVPINPNFLPCPNGWRSVVSDDDVTHCEPWPSTGAKSCASVEFHLPGQQGCSRVGSECSTGNFAEDLPNDRPAVFVLAGASAGNGTRSNPYGSIAEGLAAADANGAVVAVGKGQYLEGLELFVDTTIIGACVSETIVTLTATSGAVFHVHSGNTSVRNLQVKDSNRPAVILRTGSSIEMTDVVVDNVQNIGIYVEGATLNAQRIVVRGTGVAANGDNGIGILVRQQGSATVNDAVIEGADRIGVQAVDDGTHIELENVVIRDMKGAPTDQRLGDGLMIIMGAKAKIHSTVIERNKDFGILVSSSSGLEIEDSVIRDTDGRLLDGKFGRGIGVQLGSSATVSKTLFDNNTELGIFAGGDAYLSLADVVIRNTRARSTDGKLGRGLQVQLQTFLRANRVIFEDNATTGAIIVDVGTVARIEDIIVRRTTPREPDGFFGRGLVVTDDAVAEINRGHFSDNHDVNVTAITRGEITMEDIHISNTKPRGCASTTCADTPRGVGLAVFEEAKVTVSEFLVTKAAFCGVQLASGELDLTEGVVSNSEIGACVSAEGYDLNRLSNEVIYRDNNTNLDSSGNIAVPEPSEVEL